MRTTAAVTYETGAPWELVELELDEPREFEVRVKVMAAGLCHSDYHVMTGDAVPRFPIIGGHEGAGIVEAVGPGVSRTQVGDHVVCSYVPVCGVCRYCSQGMQGLCDSGLHAGSGMFLDGTFRFHDDEGRDYGGFCSLGTFSRQMVVSERSVVPIDPYIPFEVACLVGCGVPTGWGSSVYAAGVRAGQTVVIYGAGGVGSNAVQGAAYAGARDVVVVDPQPFKLEMAEVFGATATFSDAGEAFEYVKEKTWGQLADHAVLTPGVLTEQIVNDAIAITGKGGQVTITAVGERGKNQVVIPAAGTLLGYRRRIQGSLFGQCNPLHDIPRLLRLYQDGQLKLDELVTNTYRLEQVNEGYQDMMDGKNIRGVVLHEH